MLKYDYALLDVLATVIRNRSFKRAAEELSISQSAVSQRIKMLEEKVGASLLIRGNNQETIPTEQGKTFYAHVKMLQISEAALYRRLGYSDTRLRLCIASTPNVLATWFPEVLNRVRNELNIALEIISDESGNAENLLCGEAQAALTSQNKPHHGYRCESIGIMRYVGVASPEFIAKYFSEGINRESISKAPTLFFKNNDNALRNWAHLGFGVEDLYPAHWIPSFAGYLSSCLNGSGWGIMPYFHIKSEIANGELVLLKPEHYYDIPIFWHSGSIRSEVLTNILLIIKDIARKHLVTK